MRALSSEKARTVRKIVFFFNYHPTSVVCSVRCDSCYLQMRSIEELVRVPPVVVKAVFFSIVRVNVSLAKESSLMDLIIYFLFYVALMELAESYGNFIKVYYPI